jgi:hypothetical protein
MSLDDQELWSTEKDGLPGIGFFGFLLQSSKVEKGWPSGISRGYPTKAFS